MERLGRLVQKMIPFSSEPSGKDERAQRESRLFWKELDVWEIAHFCYIISINDITIKLLVINMCHALHSL